MRTTETRRGWLAAAAAAAALLAVVALAGGAVAEDAPPGAGATGESPPAGAPGPDPNAAGSAPPAEAPPGTGTPPDEAPPRIVRVVCTDRICGQCDGKCHRDSGHVAIDKKGHCSCTPTEGSALDRATRDAYAKQPPR